MTLSIIQPKRPINTNGWIMGSGLPRHLAHGFYSESWHYPARGLRVLSAIEVVTTTPGAEALGPEYHISISRTGPRGEATRCSSSDARWVLQHFGAEDAEEDNHTPHGIVRNFWRPVADHLSGYQCPCQDSEPAMKEDNGDYIWRGVPHK